MRDMVVLPCYNNRSVTLHIICSGLQAQAEIISNGSHRQAGAIGLHDPDAAAGGRIGTGDAPDRIVDPHRA